MKCWIYGIDTMYTVHLSKLMMCDKYKYIKISIFLFNMVIHYWLLSVSIHQYGQFSKSGFSNSSDLIPKSNQNKIVCKILIDFFTTTTTKQNIYLHCNYKHFKYHDTASYSDIFGSDTHNTIIQLYRTSLKHSLLYYIPSFHSY